MKPTPYIVTMYAPMSRHPITRAEAAQILKERPHPAFKRREGRKHYAWGSLASLTVPTLT